MAKSSTAANVIATRYATALIETAEQSNVLGAVERDMSELSAMLTASDDLKSLISNPLIRRTQQAEAMAALSEKAGFEKLTSNFLNVLANNRRLDALAKIMQAFDDLMAQRRGEVKATVRTAFALTPDQQRALQDSLKKSLGFKVHLDLSVDRSLLGGMVVTVGSRMVDDSVKGKLARLKQAMQTHSNENTDMKEVG